MKKTLVFVTLGILLVGCICGYNYYNPQIVPDDYDCEERPSLIGFEWNKYPGESTQHSLKRMALLTGKQVDEVCN